MPDHCFAPSYTVKFVAYGVWVAKEATKWNAVRGFGRKGSERIVGEGGVRAVGRMGEGQKYE